MTGEGTEAFCSGGDQSVRGEGGYDDGSEDVPRLGVLDLQVRMSSPDSNPDSCLDVICER